MNTFIFDYDDTLAFNQHYYSYSQLGLVKLVLDRLGPKAPNAPAILNRQVEIDKELVTNMGFQMERFPESFRKVYTEISQRMGRKDRAGEKRAYQLGMKVFDAKRWAKAGLVFGAAETLDFLQGKGEELMLFTAGDNRVQEQKIDVTGVKKWFRHEVYVVPRKDEHVLRGIIGQRNRERTWMVGNSMRSDILPALRVGIGAVHIPQDTWVYETEHDPAPESRRFFTLKHITELVCRYEELFGSI